MLRLYDYADSGNGFKVRLLCKLLGVPLDVVQVDILRGGAVEPDFLLKNPNGKIPLLELAPGCYLPESNAILYHLAEGTPFLAPVGYERSRILSWLFFEQYSHEPFVATPRFILRHTPADSPRRAELAWRVPKGYAALGVMEQALSAAPYLVGTAPSIADISLFAYTHRAGEAGMALGAYPAITSWIQRIEALPGFVPMELGGHDS